MNSTVKENFSLEILRKIIETNELDPLNLSAIKIRKIHGSGSNATIQKYIRVVESEAKAKAVANTLVPELPKIPDALNQSFNQLWDTAYKAAALQFMQRVEQTSHERDQANNSVVKLDMQIDESNAVIDELTNQVDALNQQILAMEASIVGKCEQAANQACAPLEATIDEKNQKISEQVNQINALSKQVNELEKEKATFDYKLTSISEAYKLEMQKNSQLAKELADMKQIMMGFKAATKKTKQIAQEKQDE